MRDLHQRAVRDAEAKRTELRLVLASRYRELVGSSDEVLHMQKRSGELDDLVKALPALMERLVVCADGDKSAGGAALPRSISGGHGESKEGEEEEAAAEAEEKEREAEDSHAKAVRIAALRRDLSCLPRRAHRCLDSSDVHGAATSLTALFSIVSGLTELYPLANALRSESLLPPGGGGSEGDLLRTDAPLRVQTKMTYLHVQTLPSRAVRAARRLLLRPSGSSNRVGGGVGGVEGAARALSALNLLDPKRTATSDPLRAVRLVELYYDSKARLMRSLLGRLREGGQDAAGGGAASSDADADEVLGRIVSILQYDVILHPYQIFVLRRFLPPPAAEKGAVTAPASDLEIHVMSSLPSFDPAVVKSKASNFLASFLPLIRAKVKSVLMSIAGTTAARLGNIRQSLYDKTDGADRMRALDENGLCRWEDAVSAVVDGRVVGAQGTVAFVAADRDAPSAGSVAVAAATASGFPPSSGARRFSLWSALFSGTFSSLVHSILSTSFHSVHSSVVSTLRSSLAAAPPLRSILPHEAYRNALRIATDLDHALLKLSDDAHKLLVHAEEREESERRLRQSLYVQTCEIMGRLLNELRRMLPSRDSQGGTGKDEDATTELIVGRLCHLLKFRLTSLPTLLDPANSPSAIASSASRNAAASGTSKSSSMGISRGEKLSMITLADLTSAFELADDDDDGLISLDEAMEAMESAFSGTSFRGAEMVRQTLLLISKGVDGVGKGGGPVEDNGSNSSPRNVTLSELLLLSSRGLRHTPYGPESALGTIQRSLDVAAVGCLASWAGAALQPALSAFRSGAVSLMDLAASAGNDEWRRLHGLPYKTGGDIAGVEGTPADAAQGTRDNAFVSGVSSHVTAYLLSLASTFHQSVCPSDSLPPVPTADYASALGISIPEGEGVESVPNMMCTIRGALLEVAIVALAGILVEVILVEADNCEEEGERNEEEDASGKPWLCACGNSALLQLLLDVTFVDYCFYERNKHGFSVLKLADAPSTEGGAFVGEDREESAVESPRKQLGAAAEAIRGSVNADALTVDVVDKLDEMLRERHLCQLASCDLFLSSLFGEDRAAGSAVTGSAPTYGVALSGATASSTTDGAPATLEPLHSTRRFALLPIQAERSLNELQMRGKYGKEKEEEAKAGALDEGMGGAMSGAMSSGFGFLSNMLKKK